MATTRIAIVTGAAKGIGRAISLRLASDGLQIVAGDLPERVKELESLVAEINSKGSKGKTQAIYHFADVTKEQEVKDLVAAAVAKFGSLDVMIANAGITYSTPMELTTLDEWDAIFAVNTRGAFLCYREAALQMIKQGKGGRIVGACSFAGKRGMSDFPAYSASKFAVRGLTQASAERLHQFGITVNAYAPAGVDTDMTPHVIEDRKRKGLPIPEAINTVPYCKPAEIAGLVSYFVSEEAGFVTGQSVSINGGLFFD